MRSAKSLKAKGKYLQNVILQKIDDGNTQLRLVTKKRKKGNRK